VSDWKLKVYHALPSGLRSAAASWRGYTLQKLRYTPETERWVEEALQRDHWSAQSWQAWQKERLAQLLHRAATRVPYYRDHWERRRRAGDNSSWEDLDNWPILEKEPLRNQPRSFLADDCDPSGMIHEHTSGTTGKSLDLWLTSDTVRKWYALFEARGRKWYGVSRHDRWAILGGQLITPVGQRQPPFWVWNAGLKQLYLSSYHLAPDLIPYYLDALKRYQVTYLYGYSSSLFAIAQEALRLGRDDLKMRVAITNAEPLFEYQRQAIAAAFQCPVRETYGMSEIVAAASECEGGQMHAWPDAGIMEILEDGQPVPVGDSGELICTGLTNTDMPLIRYRVGDRGAWATQNTICRCGRLLPLMNGIEGRSDDTLFTRDGRKIGRLDPVFKANLPVREAQIVQESLERVRVRYVPAPGFDSKAGQSIVERLQARLGSIDVILEPLDEIPRTANGKFRAVICNLPSRQKVLVKE
jgi:phenylacetate-CoA ligase